MFSDGQVQQYHKDGYVIPNFRLSDDTLTDIRSAHAQLIKSHPGFSDYCPALLPLDTSFIRFAHNPDILDMVSQLIGDNIALWNMSFFAKPARIGSKTPWHQDGQYWPIRPLATCTVWIAVDDSTPENGCLQVIRGSHKDKTLRQHQVNNGPGLALNQELPAAEYDQSKVTDIVLKAGQISLHDVYLVHGSEPNRSDLPRRGMTLRFMPTSSHYDREFEAELFANDPPSKTKDAELPQMKRRLLFLMRGIDTCGRNDFIVSNQTGKLSESPLAP